MNASRLALVALVGSLFSEGVGAAPLADRVLHVVCHLAAGDGDLPLIQPRYPGVVRGRLPRLSRVAGP